MISVHNLTKSYAGFPAVQGISFEVQPGEVVGFLGPNGAGKTTTLRILTGYLPATEGEVRVAGFDVVADSRRARRKVGYLPEDVPLYGDLRVTDFLRYLGGLKEVPSADLAAEVDRVVELTGLQPVAKRLVSTCSKGYRQRVGLAMALLGDPPVLLLDEPTSGLDPNQVIEVRDLIRRLAGEKTVLLSSHILPEVSQICGRVVIIHRGRLVASGSPQELSGGAGQEAALILRVRGNLAPAVLRAVPGVRGVDTRPGGDGFALRMESMDAAPAVARAVIEAGADLLELTPGASDLESVFREVTREEDDRA